MKIDIQSPRIASNPELDNFASAEVEKLFHLYDEILSSEVCLSLDSSSTKENKNCRVRLLIPGNDLLATAQSSSFEEAISQTVEALKKQIAKRKTKNEIRKIKVSGE